MAADEEWVDADRWRRRVENAPLDTESDYMRVLGQLREDCKLGYQRMEREAQRKCLNQQDRDHELFADYLAHTRLNTLFKKQQLPRKAVYLEQILILIMDAYGWQRERSRIYQELLPRGRDLIDARDEIPAPPPPPGVPGEEQQPARDEPVDPPWWRTPAAAGVGGIVVGFLLGTVLFSLQPNVTAEPPPSGVEHPAWDGYYFPPPRPPLPAPIPPEPPDPNPPENIDPPPHEEPFYPAPLIPDHVPESVLEEAERERHP